MYTEQYLVIEKPYVSFYLGGEPYLSVTHQLNSEIINKKHKDEKNVAPNRPPVYSKRVETRR